LTFSDIDGTKDNITCLRVTPFQLIIIIRGFNKEIDVHQN